MFWAIYHLVCQDSKEILQNKKNPHKLPLRVLQYPPQIAGKRESGFKAINIRLKTQIWAESQADITSGKTA